VQVFERSLIMHLHIVDFRLSGTMRRRDVVSLVEAVVSAWPVIARAQQLGQIRRIGLLASSPLRPIESFKRKLQELGYAMVLVRADEVVD
jgi:hypothetical protein